MAEGQDIMLMLRKGNTSVVESKTTDSSQGKENTI